MNNARGGFDSHAFPPCPALLAAVWLVAAGAPPAPASASVFAAAVRPSFAAGLSAPATLAADSARGTSDTLAQAADTTSATRAAGAPAAGGVPASHGMGALREKPAHEKKPFDEPRWVMTRSLLFPGWGQAYNGSWIKAGLVAGLEVGLAVRIADDLRALEDLDQQIAEAQAAEDAAAEAALVQQYNSRLQQATAREWWLGATVAYALLDAYIDAHFRGFKVEFENDPALGGRRPSGARLSFRWSF